MSDFSLTRLSFKSLACEEGEQDLYIKQEVFAFQTLPILENQRKLFC